MHKARSCLRSRPDSLKPAIPDFCQALGESQRFLDVWDKSAVFDQSLYKLGICRELEFFAACLDHAALEIDLYLVTHADGINCFGAYDDRKTFVETVAIVDTCKALGDDDCDTAFFDA